MYSPPPRSRLGSPPPHRRLVSPPPPRRRLASPPPRPRLVSPPPDHHRHRHDIDYDDEEDNDEENESDNDDDNNDDDNDHSADDDVHHDNYSKNQHRRHRNGHRKQRNSRSSFSMDLIRTAVTTLGDAVVNGREDGQRHVHNRQRNADYDPQSLNPWGNKTADQVYETLVQAAYTLGEVVGDLEHKLGIDPNEVRKTRNGERKSRHRGVEEGYKWGRNMARGYADEYYNPQQRPNPLRRPSSNPELDSFYQQYQDDHRDNYHSSSSRSSESSTSNKQSKHRKRTGSTPPTSKEEEASKSLKRKMIRQLPGLFTRAAFILELWELREHSKDRKTMAGKYAMMLMAVKVIEQLGQEYCCFRDRRAIKKRQG